MIDLLTPWEYHAKYEMVTPVGDMQTVIATINKVNEPLEIEQVNAIGKLIEAAPALCAVLVELLAVIDCAGPTVIENGGAWYLNLVNRAHTARAAIAKATGES